MNNIMILVALVLVAVLVMYNQTEHMTDTKDTPMEAIQMLASMYNNEQVTATNFTATGKIETTDLIPSGWKGMIVAFSGDTPPVGWAFCDGKNGTPDLRNRFIYGWGKNKINNKGGEENVTLNINQMPKHQHDTKLGINKKHRDRAAAYNFRTVPSSWKDHDGDQNRDGLEGDEYIVDTSYVGGGKAHNNMPPYYVLAYIIKL